MTKVKIYQPEIKTIFDALNKAKKMSEENSSRIIYIYQFITEGYKISYYLSFRKIKPLGSTYIGKVYFNTLDIEPGVLEEDGS